MQIPTFRYLRWFKERALHARIVLANRGMDAPPESLLPLHRMSWRLEIADTNGYRPLEERIAAHLGVTPDRVCVLPGCTCACHAAARALISPGDTVYVETPTYELLVRLAELSGAQVRRMARPPETGFSLSLGSLEEMLGEGITTILLTVPHNPSGRLLEEMQVAELAALAESHNLRILVDEVYLDFYPSPLRPYRSLAAVSDRFVTTGSLTKVHGLGNLRVGWVAGPPGVVDQVRRYQDYLSDRIPAFDAQAAVMAFDHMGALLDRAHALRQQNWPLVKSWADHLATARLLDPGAGITTILAIPEDIDSLALAEGIFEREGVLVSPAEMFGSHGFLRISFGIDRSDLEEGLKAVAQALQRAVQQVPDLER